jgi:hypothetical protein
MWLRRSSFPSFDLAPYPLTTIWRGRLSHRGAPELLARSIQARGELIVEALLLQPSRKAEDELRDCLEMDRNHQLPQVSCGILPLCSAVLLGKLMLDFTLPDLTALRVLLI